MKQDFPYAGIGKLCRLFGKTRHAYYDHRWRKGAISLKDELILHLVAEIRQSLPRLGSRKLLHLLRPQLAEHQLKVGRDELFDLLSVHGLLVRNRRRHAVTTDSRHWMKKYSNLTAELDIEMAEQLWVSDITYIRLPHRFGYLSLITDAYSRKIVGYQFSLTLSAQGCIKALEMALKDRQYPERKLVHHSDRGSQYCCKEYVDLLGQHQISISMTNNGDPYENALAERINGIIKSEFRLYQSQSSFEQTALQLDHHIHAYNSLRPHGSCDFMTPQQAHGQAGVLKKRWKNYARANYLNTFAPPV